MRETTVTPERWTARGEAEALHPQRKPLRIWGAIPGESSVVKVVHEGAHSVAGRWLRSPTPSPLRRTPSCEKYTPCGGCPLMHLTPPGQEAARRALVEGALAEHRIEAKIGAFHPCPDGEKGYRYVVKLGVGWSESERIKVGAWGRNNARIVPIPHCDVAAPVLRKTMASLAHWILTKDIWPWDPETGKGTLRSAVLRASRTTGEVMITLVAGKHTPELSELAAEVSAGVGEVAGVWLHINDEPGNAIFVRDDQGVVGVLPLSGRDWLEERLNGVAYRIGPGDFFQTNPSTAEVLLRRVVDRLDPGPEDAVVDLYCGVGGFALQAASRAAFAVGVEEVEGAVARAKEASRINRLNAEFQLGKVVDVLPELGKRLAGSRPLVTVDPARRGLEDGVIAAIAALNPRRLVYVSCNPRALARDLAELQGLGFRLEGDLELFDMFPQTPHVEVVASLVGPEGEAATRRAPRRKLVR